MSEHLKKVLRDFQDNRHVLIVGLCEKGTQIINDVDNSIPKLIKILEENERLKEKYEQEVETHNKSPSEEQNVTLNLDEKHSSFTTHDEYDIIPNQVAKQVAKQEATITLEFDHVTEVSHDHKMADMNDSIVSFVSGFTMAHDGRNADAFKPDFSLVFPLNRTDETDSIVDHGVQSMADVEGLSSTATDGPSFVILDRKVADSEDYKVLLKEYKSIKEKNRDLTLALQQHVANETELRKTNQRLQTFKRTFQRNHTGSGIRYDFTNIVENCKSDKEEINPQTLSEVTSQVVSEQDNGETNIADDFSSGDSFEFIQKATDLLKKETQNVIEIKEKIQLQRNTSEELLGKKKSLYESSLIKYKELNLGNDTESDYSYKSVDSANDTSVPGINPIESSFNLSEAIERDTSDTSQDSDTEQSFPGLSNELAEILHEYNMFESCYKIDAKVFLDNNFEELDEGKKHQTLIELLLIAKSEMEEYNNSANHGVNSDDSMPIAVEVINSIKQKFVDANSLFPDLATMDGLNRYISGCVKLTKKMIQQSDAITLDSSTGINKRFKKKRQELSFNSNSPELPGAVVKYYLFPTLLHNGEVLKKGKVFVSQH